MTQRRCLELCLLACVGLGSGCPSDDGDDQTTATTETTTMGMTSDTTSSTSAGTTSTSTTTTSDTSSATTAATTQADTGTAGSTTMDTGSTTGTMGEVPPTGEAALVPWLQAGNYSEWDAESAVHGSAGPHNDVRTFVNATMFDSLSAGATEHPVGSAAVKELYSGQNLDGWAVTVKVAPGAGGATWYWFEIVGTQVYADGEDVTLCTTCHGSGQDYFRSPFPLQ